MKKVIFATVALAVLAGASWGVYAAVRPRAGSSAQSTLETHLVTETTFNISTTCNGELEAKRQIEVRSKLDNMSTIAWIIPEGTSVKKDEVLVRLNSDDLETRRIEAELQVENAKAAFAKAQTELEIQNKENSSKISAAQVKFDVAKLALEQWVKGDNVQKHKDNQQAIEKSRAEHDRLKEKYEKSVLLQKEEFLSTDELKRDKLAYDESVRALEKALLAQETYDKYESIKDHTTKKSDVDQAESELERVKQQAEIELKSKETARNTSKRQLDVQEQKLSKLVESISNATLSAPADGLVVYSTSMERSRWGDSEGPLQIGRQVYPNQLLIVLPDTTEMVASVRIHESMQSRVKPGQKASVKIDAAGGRSFEATVDNIGILAESGGWRDPNLREYTVKMNLKDDGVALKPAMRCEAEIIMGQVENALAIPIQAIFNEGMLRFVYVPASASSGKYVKRAVSTGRMSERFAEVSAGIKSGERVLLREPSAGEVLDQAWDQAELAAAGYKQNDEGQIVRVGGGPGGGQGGPGGNRPGGREGRNRGNNNATAAKPGADKPVSDAKPAGDKNESSASPEVKKDGAESTTTITPTAPASDTKSDTEKKSDTDK